MDHEIPLALDPDSQTAVDEVLLVVERMNKVGNILKSHRFARDGSGVPNVYMTFGPPPTPVAGNSGSP
jgi:hypothetical protein